jgi:hypothetical protein
MGASSAHREKIGLFSDDWSSFIRATIAAGNLACSDAALG